VIYMPPRRTVRSLEDLARVLTEARQKAGVRFAVDLAQRCDLPVNTVCRWLRGANEPGVLSLARVAHELGVSLDALAYDDSEPALTAIAPAVNLSGITPLDRERLAALVRRLTEIMRAAPDSEAIAESLAAVEQINRLVVRAESARGSPAPARSRR
jgi:transcriptional regulator with XRE-family HTH domain